MQKAGATGELIFNVIACMKITLNKNIASCLYAAITTDTGNFSYSNTTPDTMRIAADILDTGIDLPYLNRCLFRTIPFHKLKLHALAVSKTQLFEYGRIGISFITMDEIQSCGATNEDSEGIIDSIRDIDSVEIAAFLRESEGGLIRVSLRGKSSADVSRIATRFGGGGHKLAAGCTLEASVESAFGQILDAAKELLVGSGD
ncbi:Bifunctional oligoribonuclease and PAP phosphatase NrnA [bioreactor metagenome]|uniref:Bifunctional oligoribonuclease and PAP phosphatase NrnA n=1 Tax=bioreactor metagenome TaxID=1076179 RepID=A0A645C9V3_9ZZZZ